jgi:hypothetical protein
MNQFEMNTRPPATEVDRSLIARLPSMTKALVLCQTLSGMDDKCFVGEHGVVKDAAQWSRIMNSGQHNFPQEKLNLFMDKAGNEVPMLWLLHSRGYDIARLSKLETETERELRQTREALASERQKNKVLVDAMHGRASV